MDNIENDQPVQNCHDPVKKSNTSAGEPLHSTPAHSHRSRKQKHERILNTEMEDPIFPSSAQQPPVALPEQNGTVATYPEHEIGEAKAQDPMDPTNQLSQAPTPASTGKRRGRPKRVQNQSAIEPPANLPNQYTPADTPQEVKSRRVQLLRKRLAIDMVSQDQLPDAPSAGAGLGQQSAVAEDEPAGVVETPTRRDRQLRATRRTTTPSQQATPKATRKRQSKASAQASQLPPPPPPMLVQFGGSDTESNNNNNNNSTSMSFALAAQIDLTMCSSSSSTSSGAPGAHQTASGISGSGSSSMLPPTTILSSSDRLKDVIFQPNDFSSIMATQQLRSPRPSSTSGGSAGGSQPDSHDEDNYNSALDNSGGEQQIVSY